MKFGQAIDALEEGKRVARKGWNGKGMFIYLVQGKTVDYSNLRDSAKDAADARTKIEGGEIGSPRYINSHIDMMNNYGQIVIGWNASQPDMLADDWEVLV